MNGKIINLNNFYVSCLPNVSTFSKSINSKIIFSFLDPSINESLLPSFHKSVVNCKYYMFDQEKGSHVEKLYIEIEKFIRNILELKPLSNSQNTIFHCHAGVSRSTAACYVAIASELGKGNEKMAFDMLLNNTNKPWPNDAIIQYADEILGRQGALLEPVNQYKEKYNKRLLAYRRLNAKRGLVSPVPRVE